MLVFGEVVAKELKDSNPYRITVCNNGDNISITDTRMMFFLNSISWEHCRNRWNSYKNLPEIPELEEGEGVVIAEGMIEEANPTKKNIQNLFQSLPDGAERIELTGLSMDVESYLGRIYRLQDSGRLGAVNSEFLWIFEELEACHYHTEEEGDPIYIEANTDPGKVIAVVMPLNVSDNDVRSTISAYL